ncbi:MAG TPA: beta-propeller domain-containing protein [Longimicrobium sp.]|nr:beta-propeller domain-containing protein [Longimicrobium sp.]
MKRRLVLALGAALLLSPDFSHAQSGTPAADTLPAFGSRHALADWLSARDRERQRHLAQIAAARRAAAQAAAAQAAAQPAASAATWPPPACPATTTPALADSAKGPAVVHGRVVSASGAPLVSAVVRTCASGSPLGTTTAADGSYRLVIPRNRVPVQPVAITVSSIGHTPAARQVAVAPGDSAVADFTLQASAVYLSEVVATAAGITTAARNEESVTNTQTAGVDEGGIVKVHGDHLVMLRRGRLFTVAIGDRRLTPVSAVDAFGPGMDGSDAWYDEMLVSGNRVVVIGYNYGSGGTEIGLFDIDRAGRLRYRATYHLRSNDYYSSRNYASRLVGSKLIFYTPLGVPSAEPVEKWLPALRRWHQNATDDEFRPIVSATRIYRPGRPLEPTAGLTLHTVTTCDLAQPEMRCSATAVLGPSGEVFYVSATSVYVWTSDGWRNRGRQDRGPAMVYRLPLDGSAPSALAAAGSPVDQFSFMESADGHLNVLVRSGAGGAWMWSAERAGGSVALLRVPLKRFGDGSTAAPRSAYRELPAPSTGYAFQNRFVGAHLLYGGGSGWGRPDRSRRWTLYAVPFAGGAADSVALPHGVDRIDVMGPEGVVIGTDGRNLHFTGIALHGRPRARQHYVSRGASQGELRSHGFFYKPDWGDDNSGTLGLPIRGPARPGWEHLYDESASVLFLRNERTAFRALGTLDARPNRSGADEDADGCVASCVDWYGNSRPLFLRGRVFALLGYEIVEGQVTDGRIREVRRVSYAPRRLQASRE